uniref:DUF1610 domain-containing protein n=1 Tax=Mesocestoides corti TaxID=53468 RepID=A0A5K3EID1_MESCO
MRERKAANQRRTWMRCSICGVTSDQGEGIVDHLASANPVALCVLMACEEDKQPIREGLG